MAPPGTASEDDGNPRSDPALDLLHTVVRATVLLTCGSLVTMVVLVALTGRDSAIVPLAGVISALFALLAALGRLAFGWLSARR